MSQYRLEGGRRSIAEETGAALNAGTRQHVHVPYQNLSS